MFILRNIMDDGKTTMVMNKMQDHEIYLIANCAVYYRLEKEEYKDKAFLCVTYHSECELVLYASNSTPRPSKRNNELQISSPKIVSFGASFFEEPCLYLTLSSSKQYYNKIIGTGCHVTAKVYHNKNLIPSFAKARSTERTQMTLKQRQELLTKQQEKPFNISQKKYEIELRMRGVLETPGQFVKLRNTVRDIRTAQRQNNNGVIESNK